MTIKVRITGPSLRRIARARALRASALDRSFIDTLDECAGPQALNALNNQQFRKFRSPSPITRPTAKNVAAPVVSPKRSVGLGLINKAFSWATMRFVQRPARKLHVAETIALGEKRFVAILQVENSKYLIGGSASSVSLLTQLGTATETPIQPTLQLAPQDASSRGGY